MTFNDADLIYTNYYSFIRIPAHQSVEVECLGRFSNRFWPVEILDQLKVSAWKPVPAGDAIKVGVCYYIDAPEVITGRNNGCHDLWRIKSNETMKIAYVGPDKGAGLEMPNSKIVFQGRVRSSIELFGSHPLESRNLYRTKLKMFKFWTLMWSPIYWKLEKIADLSQTVEA